MAGNNHLFWISLAGVIALGVLLLLIRFVRSKRRRADPKTSALPTDED
jgi:heme/copper-type cytochrome/quinol oxidase subunit 2